MVEILSQNFPLRFSRKQFSTVTSKLSILLYRSLREELSLPSCIVLMLMPFSLLNLVLNYAVVKMMTEFFSVSLFTVASHQFRSDRLSLKSVRINYSFVMYDWDNRLRVAAVFIFYNIRELIFKRLNKTCFKLRNLTLRDKNLLP